MIPTDKPHLHVVALSHPGEMRTKNEDCYSVTAYRLERSATPALLAIVADGIGGHLAGEVASRMTVDTLIENMTAADGRIPIEQLHEAVNETNRVVSRAALADKDHQGMGSTLTVAWIIDLNLYICNVGDSRLYLHRQSELRQISVDHTWVQEAIEHDIIQPDQARHHPQAHVLRRHIGGHDEVVPDMRLRLSSQETDEQSLANQGVRLQSRDQILLCSDGLTDLVTDAEIQGTLQHTTPIDAVANLIDLARARGGHDNITIVLLEVPDQEQPQGKTKLRRSTWSLITVLSLVILTVLVLIGVAVSWWLGFWP